MDPLIADLLRDGPVTIDGAWGTQLQARGLPVGECPDVWNLERPDAVEMVARSYVDAGSKIILTNTFGANRFILERHGLAGRLGEINRAGAALSKQAAGDRAKVFASIGPSGKMLMMGEVEEADLVSAFEEQAAALAEGGAEALVVETMSDPEEACLAVQAAKKTGLPVVACLVFDAGADKDRTMMGTTPEQGAQMLGEAGADVIGSNCGQGIEGFASICRRMRAVTQLPIWMKPNAGLPEMVDGQVLYRTSPDEFASHVPDLVAAGAGMIGACCGSSPDFVQAIRKALGSARR
jgi:methionine synthase I (cobalamin-dependent)